MRHRRLSSLTLAYEMYEIIERKKADARGGKKERCMMITALPAFN